MAHESSDVIVTDPGPAIFSGVTPPGSPTVKLETTADHSCGANATSDGFTVPASYVNGGANVSHSCRTLARPSAEKSM